MQIPASYFNDEVREGFFVPSMMKHCWAAQMEVLSDIDVICQKYHISYVADSGTMIGAVRHGGFIPWDDDLDIIMYREDYETFLAHADELPSNYAVLNWRNEDGWNDAFSRVVNSREIRFDEEFLTAYHGFPYSAGVDVFVLDYLYRDETKEEERRERAKYLLEAAAAIAREASFTEEAEHLLETLERQFAFCVDRTGNIIRQLFQKVEEYLTEVPYEEADRTCFMSAWMKYHSTAIYKDAYRDTMSVLFEIREIPVPVAYDDVLKSRYGDYMRVFRNGGLHDYPYYKAQEKILSERFGWKSWNYGWLPEEMTLGKRTHEAERQKRDALKEKLSQIKSLIASAPETFGELQGQVDQLEQSLHLRGGEQEEVVFLTIGNTAWNNFKYFWEAESKKPNVSVFVIAIPYFDLNIEGAVICEHYTDEFFPGEVGVTSFNDYNLEVRHPDRIYFQIPYDSENPTMTVHPVFYSDALLKYTEELIYVPFLPIKTIETDDDKSFYSMNFYVKMPGVLHADRIFLPTENLKEQYLRALTEFGGEEVREEFDRRIEVVDYMPDHRPGAKKKKMFFHSNVAFFVLHREKALEKLKRNLELFRENTDHIQLYWQISAHADEVLQSRNPKIYEQLMQIMDQYRAEQWGITVDSSDRETIKEMDAFYGDPGIMAHTANALGIPVMLQNVEC